SILLILTRHLLPLFMSFCFFFTDAATTEIYTLSLHDALPICIHDKALADYRRAYESRHKILNGFMPFWRSLDKTFGQVDKKLTRSEEHTSELQSRFDLVCRLLLEKKKRIKE